MSLCFHLLESRLWLRLILISIAVLGQCLRSETALQLSDSSGSSGSRIDVALKLFNSDAVSGAQIDLWVDPEVAEIESIEGSLGNAGHTIDSQALGGGRVRVVIYSNDSEVLSAETLLNLRILLNSTVGEGGRSVVAESVILADDRAGFVGSALIPNATFSGPDSSVVYNMGDSVSASSVAFDTNGSIDQVEFLVNGRRVGSDASPPYESDFPLRAFGNIQLSVQAIDDEGNRFETSRESYVVNFPQNLDSWLDVFFSSEERQNPDVGGLLADIDLDGRTTLMEYAFGLHPRASDVPQEFGFFRDSETGLYYFSFLRPTGVTEVDYRLELSNELETWSVLGVAESAEIIPVDDFIEKVRIPLEETEGGAQFGRIQMESVAP